ncbi:hypothetical protein [Pleionea sp. CnH1-48]|uniref:hypothetical protein n=1 Tax=Pleionea sp. CnH1-48 TaxID=2954494 RepID=UPI002096E72C|nr:hypothetical protein [Pleionea sp. CnH1-48]MCO7223189.1 hypothetical protein [Pleionea sp. CnH1-48]
MRLIDVLICAVILAGVSGYTGWYFGRNFEQDKQAHEQRIAQANGMSQKEVIQQPMAAAPMLAAVEPSKVSDSSILNELSSIEPSVEPKPDIDDRYPTINKPSQSQRLRPKLVAPDQSLLSHAQQRDAERNGTSESSTVKSNNELPAYYSSDGKKASISREGGGESVYLSEELEEEAFHSIISSNDECQWLVGRISELHRIIEAGGRDGRSRFCEELNERRDELVKDQCKTGYWEVSELGC